LTDPERQDPIQDLVRRAQDGDPRAFEELARAAYGRIHRWALVRTGDRDDAEDVAQAVLIQVFRKLNTYAGQSAFFSWLYRVTGNVAGELERRRSVESRGRRRFLMLVSGVRTPESSIVADIEKREMRDLVRAFFEELPPRQREIFDLVDLQGFTPAEVADMLNMNPNTVRANLLKARRVLRRRMLARDPSYAEEFGR
jgi:RNA polymerase sigma-70 factor (ECF subfamily)